MEDSVLTEFAERLRNVGQSFIRLGPLEELQNEFNSCFKIKQPSDIQTALEKSRAIRQRIDALLEQPVHEYDQASMRFFEAIRNIPQAERLQSAVLLSHGDRQALWPYYWRAGWLSIEEQSVERLLSGLAIYAFRSGTVTDWRDVICELAPAHIYAQELGCDIPTLFRQAADFAAPDLAEPMKKFGDRTDITAGAFGWKRVETQSGSRFRQNI